MTTYKASAEIDAPAERVWEVPTGLEMIADHVLERMPPGATRVHLSMQFQGWLGGLLGAAFGGVARDYIAQEARSLKLRAEALAANQRMRAA